MFVTVTLDHSTNVVVFVPEDVKSVFEALLGVPQTRSSAVAGRAILRIIEYFAKSLKIIRNDTVE